MRKKRRSNKDRRKFLSIVLIILVLLLAVTLYFFFNALEDFDISGELKTIGIVSVDDDPNTTSIIDISINSNVVKSVNFTHLSISDSIPYNHLSFYMPFDENDDTNSVYDYASGNDGSLSGGPSFSQCIYGMCYEFDGGNDFIGFINQDLLDFGDEAFTISLWVKGGGSSEGILTNDNINAQDDGIVILKNSDGDYSYNNGSASFVIGAGDSNWHHLVVKRETVGNNRLSLYFDGEFVSNHTDERTLSNDKSPLIGADFGGSAFGGFIDEIMIFNASLDAAEVSNIYENQSARYESEGTITLRHFNLLENEGHNIVDVTTENFETELDSSLELRLGYWDVSSGYTDDSGDSINSGLKIYWHADGNPNDASGNDHNGVEEGGLTYSEGVWGEAFEFDGEDSYLNTTITTFEDEGDIAVSFWIRPKDSGNVDYTRVISKSIPGSGGWGFEQNNSNNGEYYFFWLSDTNLIVPDVTLDLEENVWSYVAVNLNTTELVYHVNGVSSGNFVHSSPFTNNAGASLILGSWATDDERYFEGALDEIMIFDRSLDLDEVEELYVKGRANYDFTDFEEVDGDNEFEISIDSTNLLPEYKFIASSNQFYTPLLFTGIRFDYSIDNSEDNNEIFVDNGIVDIVFPFNGSNTRNRFLDVNYTVAYENVSNCWYSNDSFSVNITLNNCENITDVEWKRGLHEVRVYANSTNGSESASRVFFTVLSNVSNFIDETEDTDFNQTNPIDTSNPTVIVDSEPVTLGAEEESDPSLIVYWLIIGILLILIFIVIFFLIKARKSHGIIG